MKRTLSLLIVAAACFVLAAPVFAQDSDQQSLGDMVRKDKAKAKPKAKATLDEDNTQPAPPASQSSAPASTASPSTGDTAAPANGDQAAAAQDSPGGSAQSNADKLQELQKQESTMKQGLATLQDKIDNSPNSDPATVDIWRSTLAAGQQRLAETQKQIQALQSAPSGQQSSAQPTPPQQVSPQQ